MRLSPAPDPKTASTAIGPANGDHARPGAIQAAFAAAKASCSSGVTTTLSALSVSIVVLVGLLLFIAHRAAFLMLCWHASGC